MLRALLLDLDDTMLVNPMASFVPAYLDALGRWADALVPRQRLINELLRATAAMETNDGSGPTNAETFAAVFFPAIGADRAEAEALFERFYDEAYPALAALTRPVPEAAALLSWARGCGLQVAVATNPVFPRTAIEQRLAWAGLPVGEQDFALVTSYEEMRATKSHPAYYRQILARLGRHAEECLMVGDDWAWDVLQPGAVGIRSFWIAAAERTPPAPAANLVGHGSLADLARALDGGTLASLL